MPREVASALCGLVQTYFPLGLSSKEEKEGVSEISKLAVGASVMMFYDAVIHMSSFDIALWALTLLKFVNRASRLNRDQATQTEVVNSLKSFEGMVNRSPEKHKTAFQEMFRVFRQGFEDGDLTWPVFPPNVMVQLQK